MGLLAVEPVLLEEGLEGIQHGHALSGVVGGHLGEQQGGGDGVLVPDEVPQHVAVALLVGEDHLPLPGSLQGVLLLGDELKAGEGVEARHAATVRAISVVTMVFRATALPGSLPVRCMAPSM